MCVCLIHSSVDCDVLTRVSCILLYAIYCTARWPVLTVNCISAHYNHVMMIMMMCISVRRSTTISWRRRRICEYRFPSLASLRRLQRQMHSSDVSGAIATVGTGRDGHSWPPHFYTWLEGSKRERRREGNQQKKRREKGFGWEGSGFLIYTAFIPQTLLAQKVIISNNNTST